MSKVWYRAVCDKHHEMCTVMVDSPIRSHAYLSNYSDTIYQWLQHHYGCELRLVWRDDQYDPSCANPPRDEPCLHDTHSTVLKP